MRSKHLCSIIVIVFVVALSVVYITNYAFAGLGNQEAQGQSISGSNPSNNMLSTSSEGQWVRMSSGTFANLSSVFGGASFMFAVGANGTLLHYDGFEWSTIPTPTTVPLNGIWGVSPEDAYIVGAAGNIFHLDSAGIIKMSPITSANLNAVWGSSPADVLAVGDNGNILRYDGTAWAHETTWTTSRLWAVGGSKRGDVFAVGNNGTILQHGDDETWHLMDTPTTARLFAVWVGDSGNAVAVGAAGIALHYSGGEWHSVATPTTVNLNGVWGISATQIYAVGANGTILEFDGDQWLLSRASTNLQLTAVNNGYAVGDNGNVFQNATLFLEAANLRITELDPWSARVEVTNFGPPFTTGNLPFCHRMNCDSSIPSGTVFGAGGIHVFPVPNMNRSNTDLWLYRMMPFSDPNNLIHGVRYGSLPSVGNTMVAVEAEKWTSADTFAPAPSYGTSLAFDGYGDDPKDWYTDETPTFGRSDYTRPGTVERSLYFPAGTQDFEEVFLGDEAIAITDWKIIDDGAIPGMFTVRVVEDVAGIVDPRGESTRWLRIRDQNGHDLRNEVVSPSIAVPDLTDDQWAFWVNLEEQPDGAGACPAIMVQHASVKSGTLRSSWGIEFRENDWFLVVTEFGGVPTETRLVMPTPRLEQWVFIQIVSILEHDAVRVLINGNDAGEVRTDLDQDADRRLVRLAYQGNGPGNTGTLLLDDVSFQTLPIAMPFFAAFTAETVEAAVALRWGVRDGEPLESFTIYRDEELVAGPLPANARGYEDSGLEMGNTYRYVIGALKPDGMTVRSRPVTITIEALQAVVFGDLSSQARRDAVVLSWDAQLNEPVEGFRIYRRDLAQAVEIDVVGPVLLQQDVRRFEDVDVSSGAWYEYRIVAVTAKGAEVPSRLTRVQVPKPPLEISNVFPNPFRSTASLEFTIPEAGRVTGSVYDVRGKLVARLSDGIKPPGTHVLTWNGRDGNGNRVSAGTYFLKLEVPHVISTKKVVLVR